MMSEAQKRAWDCLTETEQQSLTLQILGNKSSWEAGSILNLAHYKYVEIRERAEKFFKLYTQMFERHSAIFRPDSPCEEAFKDYIEGVIEKRLTRVEASVQTGDSTNLLQKRRTQVILRNMIRLKDSDNPWDIDTLRFIFEFDRWNNFRVLPHKLQQPSAYKRRLNKRDKIYIKYLLKNVPEWVHIKIKERFKYKVNKPVKKHWICLISEELYDDGYLVMPVRPTEEVVKEMNRFYIYVFDDKEDADTFGFMVSKFMDKTKGVKFGQQFWPEYREVIQKAVNYNEVNNIEFGVKTLDNAYGVNRKPKKVKKSKNKKGFKRADPDLFNKL